MIINSEKRLNLTHKYRTLNFKNDIKRKWQLEVLTKTREMHKNWAQLRQDKTEKDSTQRRSGASQHMTKTSIF